MPIISEELWQTITELLPKIFSSISSKSQVQYTMEDELVNIIAKMPIGNLIVVGIFRHGWLDAPDRLYQRHKKREYLSGHEHRCGAGQKPSDVRMRNLIEIVKSACVAFLVIIRSNPLLDGKKEMHKYLSKLLVRKKITKIYVTAWSLNHNRLGSWDRHARDLDFIYNC